MKHEQTLKTGDFLRSARRTDVPNAVNNTTTSLVNSDPYRSVLPANIDVFSSLKTDLASLEDTNVFEQVQQVLSALYLALQTANKRRLLKNYLSRISLLQQEDKAVLLEWNFHDFRVGLTLEPNKNESSFFIVSRDKVAGSFNADTQILGASIMRSVGIIVDYVLENT
jgi:hypothetical protein